MQEEAVDAQQIFQNIPQSIIASLHTHLTQYKLEDTSNIDLNTDIDEQSLNKIIAQLLVANGKEGDGQVLFDFLVGGKLLRGQLKSHLVRYEISCEDVVEIQYFVAFREFKESKQAIVEDWVAGIAEVMGVDQNIGVLAGLFDGSVVFYEHASKKESKIKGKLHEGAIKAIKVVPSEEENTYYIISGGIDEELAVSKFSQHKQPEVISLNAQEGSIFAIDFNPMLDGHVCSAGASGNLHIWKIPENFLQDQTLSEVKTEKKKKKKTNKKQLPHLTEHQTHKDAINSLCWLTSSSVATGSSDHSIKATDIQKMREIRTLLTKDSITTGLDYRNNTILSSHEDGYIRSWDLRSSTSSPTQTYKSHSRYSSSVRIHNHSNIFATCSYDQTVKIWDTRSVFPLQTLITNYDKVFALSWRSEEELVVGGSNPYLGFYAV